MEQILSISKLSIAELKKILIDNDIKDISTSKNDLIQLVSDTLLTAMMLTDLQKDEDKYLKEAEELSKNIEQNKITQERYDRRLLQQQQDQDYKEALTIDSLIDITPIDVNDPYDSCFTINPSINGMGELSPNDMGELSPNSLRAVRIKRFE